MGVTAYSVVWGSYVPNDHRLRGDRLKAVVSVGCLSFDQEWHMTDERSSSEQAGRRHVAWLLFGVRYALPVLAVLAGVIVMVLGSETDAEGGAGIVSAGLAIYAMNWLYRAAVDGDRVRDQEEAARIYLDTHGHWPDERPRG